MPDGALPARLTINGIEQQYYSEVDDEVDSNDKELETIPGGFIGHSNGTSMHRINGRSLIPNTGREFDFIDCADNHKTIDLGFRLQGKTREYRGRIKTAKEMSKTNDIVDIQWTFTGRRIR